MDVNPVRDSYVRSSQGGEGGQGEPSRVGSGNLSGNMNERVASCFRAVSFPSLPQMTTALQLEPPVREQVGPPDEHGPEKQDQEEGYALATEQARAQGIRLLCRGRKWTATARSSLPTQGGSP